MALEDTLERIATALETIAAASGDAAPAAPPEKSEKPAKRPRKPRAEAPASPPAADPEPPAVTLDQVREAMRAFRKDHGKPEAIAILAKFGTKSISAATEDSLPGLLAAFSE